MHCQNRAKPVHVLAGLLNELHTGNGRVHGMAGCGQEHDSLHSWLCQHLMRGPKLMRKSTPIMGIWTLATTTCQVEIQFSPKMRARETHPWVGMVVLLAAKRS